MNQKRTTWQKVAVREELGSRDGFISAQQLHSEMVATGQKLDRGAIEHLNRVSPAWALAVLKKIKVDFPEPRDVLNLNALVHTRISGTNRKRQREEPSSNQGPLPASRSRFDQDHRSYETHSSRSSTPSSSSTGEAKVPNPPSGYRVLWSERHSCHYFYHPETKHTFWAREK